MNQVTAHQAMHALRICGALFDGHYVGTQDDPELPDRKGGGLHMDKYVDGREVLTYPDIVEGLGGGIAWELQGLGIEIVVGVPLGSYTLAHEVAKSLGVRYVMAERRVDGKLVIKRPAFIKAIRGKRVGVVEDTMSRGDTALKAVSSVTQCTDADGINVGATVAGVGCVINRGSASEESLGVPLRALVCAEDMPMLTRQECLRDGWCARGVPINTDRGHGADMYQLIKDGLLPPDRRIRFA